VLTWHVATERLARATRSTSLEPFHVARVFATLDLMTGAAPSTLSPDE
jgi:alkanesulfonate monooxygenase SsuD/methylene tetrahydromethanopterin reductase-like flavin-dependent oxidoreductase (luciferase family)